jgi:hypothetical protein
MSGLETIILSLKAQGFPLILLWLLTLSVVYGILSHIKMPNSIPARGTIAIVAAFMVLFAAASSQATAFVENIVVSGVVIAFGLLIVMIFLEILGAKHEGAHVFAKHPMLTAIVIIILFALIFIGAGGLGILNIPAIDITDSLIAIIFFIAVMAIAVFIMMKETKKS